MASLLAAAVLAAGCGRSYPRDDAPSVRQMTVAEHLQVLNRYLAGGATQRRLAPRDDCHLVLKKKAGDSGVMQRILIPLLETSVEVAGRPSGTGLRVKLTRHEEDRRRVQLRLDLDHWVDAVAWRSHFEQLQLHCREASTTPGDARHTMPTSRSDAG